MRHWLIALREELGLSQQALADKIGIGQSTYGAFEKGVRDPSVCMAKKIAAFMGFDWTKFFEDAEDRETA